ncbi:zinc finger protein ZFP2-like isoform X1 [Spodoptera frugiperda]|uniref:Zinc finger protein ZFP2-like isoform X1 n=1 Tax=Spodoptera frugiperda TaxID=7108 RepID=A0A9R0ETX6_SPOFR|nr:zinc finger protein ZFP2-like isoform X1 [Spodoptera frugiperda]
MQATVECERILVLCHGCLSADRKISYVTGRRKTLFTKLRGDKRNENDQDLLLCWECKALLNKTHQFQTRIKAAQKQLVDYLNGYIYDKNKFSTYTHLSNTKTPECDYIYVYEEEIKEIDVFSTQNEIEMQLDTKEELHVDQEDNFIAENGDLLQEIKEEFDNGVKDEIDSLNCNDNDDIDLFDTDYKIEEGERDLIQKKKEKKKKPYGYQSLKKYANLTTCRVIHDTFTDAVEEFYDAVNLDFCDIKENNIKCSLTKAKFVCKICKIGFIKYLDYARHNVFKHIEFSYPTNCKICKEAITSASHLHAHWKQRHNIMMRCKYCGDISRNKGELKKHLNRTHTKIYTCDKCALEFPTLRIFREHYKNVHEVFECDYCQKQFKVKLRLEAHIKRLHFPLSCSICKKNYRNFSKYTLHMKHYHPELAPIKINTKIKLTSKELRYCVECDKQFASVYLYKQHVKWSTKHTPRPKVSVPCPVCNKMFSKASYRNNHYRLFHTNKTKHYCDICDKYFATGFGKRTHFASVHQKIPKPKDKICDLCGRGFHTNRVLTHHRRTHTGERPYKCGYCPAAFAQKYAMTTHQKTQHKDVISSSYQPQDVLCVTQS